MLSTYLRSATLLCFPLVALAAPFPSSKQILLGSQGNIEKASPVNYEFSARLPALSPGISKSLFDEFVELAKVVDITNCAGSIEGITYPFQCNSFCREFPGLELVKQWNTNDDLADQGEGTRGYVAVDHDGRKIFVAIAGGYSSSPTAETVDYKHVCPGCKVHKGFHKEWVKAEEAIKELVKQYVEASNPYKVVLVGSQAGGAVVTLAAADFVAKGWNPELTTFGQPMVGNDQYAQFLARKFTPLTYRRVTHISDPTPNYPLTEDNPSFSHYEQSFIITKPFAPYTPFDVVSCASNLEPGCEVPLTPIAAPVSADYFHHSDNCLASELSILSVIIEITEFETEIIDDWSLKSKRSLPDTDLNADHDIFVDLPQYMTGPGHYKRKISETGDEKANPDAEAETTVPDSKFEKTFAMVEKKKVAPESEREPVYVPEYEDKEIYSAMAGFSKAQSMWIKPKPVPDPATSEKSKRSKLSEDGTSVESAALKNTLEMLDKPAPVPTEYEDKEIYDTMAGFDKAQKMWIKKPQGVASKQKISDEFFEDQMLPESDEIEKRDIITIDPVNILSGWSGMGQESVVEAGHTSRNLQQQQTTLEKRHSTLNVKALTEPSQVENITEATIEKRGFDRALRFFNAPKDVLDAQLAANQESAAYNAQQRALAGGNAPSETGESGDPDEDYFRKGGSVLLLNGRPLEVDGHPVLFEPKEKKPAPVPAPAQKRSVIPAQKSTRGPGLGLKKGGLRRGDKDCEKVTKLQSAPGDTRSVSEVGGFANAFPASFGEEVVNVQKGRNVVLMNGQPMPANFAQKSVYGDDLPAAAGSADAEDEDARPFAHGMRYKPKSRCDPEDTECVNEADRFFGGGGSGESLNPKLKASSASLISEEGKASVSIPSSEQVQKDIPSLKEMWTNHEKAGSPIIAVVEASADAAEAKAETEE